MTFTAFETRAAAAADLVILDRVAYNAALAQSAGYVVVLVLMMMAQPMRGSRNDHAREDVFLCRDVV